MRWHNTSFSFVGRPQKCQPGLSPQELADVSVRKRKREREKGRERERKGEREGEREREGEEGRGRRNIEMAAQVNRHVIVSLTIT